VRLIYLDSCILIYAVQDASTRGDAVRSRIGREKSRLAISPLVMLECLVDALRRDDQPLRDHFNRVFKSCGLLDLAVPEFVQAAELRAQHGIGTADSLHLAAAQISGCDKLWTNDTRLSAASRGFAVNLLG